MSDTHETAYVHIGDPIAEWCPQCIKTTLMRSSLYALASDGPHRMGEYAICEECAYSPYQEDTR